jgi:hypothetical protein
MNGCVFQVSVFQVGLTEICSTKRGSTQVRNNRWMVVSPLIPCFYFFPLCAEEAHKMLGVAHEVLLSP